MTSPSVSRGSIAFFVLTYLAYVAIYFARKPVSVVKATLETELGLSRAALGTIDTALLTAYAIGQFIIGLTVRVLGRDGALVTAFAACGVLTAAFGFATSAGMMAALWGGSGFFAAVVHPLMVLLVVDLFPPSMRASAVSIWQTSQQMGGVTANAVASAVLSRRGWRAVFHSSGAIVGAFAPLLAIALYARAGAATNGSPAVVQARQGGSKAAAPRSLSSLAGLRSVGVAYTMVKMARYCLMFWLPYFFAKHVKTGPAMAALISTVFDMAGVLGSLFGGFVCDSFCGGRMLGLTLPLSLATSLAFAGWAVVCLLERGGPPLMGGALHVVAMAVVGFLIASPDGVLGGPAARNLCDYAGAADDRELAAAASGLINGCGSVGSILQGVLTAGLVDAVGWPGLFLSLSLAMVGAAVAVQPAAMLERQFLQRRA